MSVDKINELKEKLNKIGFEVKGRYPNRFIYDANGNRTKYRVLNDRIEYDLDLENYISYCTCFYFDGAIIEMIDNDAVSVGTKECFVMFMNHSDIRGKNATNRQTFKSQKLSNE